MATARAYYNENEPFAVKWLKNLISRGLIPNGDVDDRSIVDVQETDLVGYSQCHFFAGLGGWLLALNLAGWPKDRPVWTGSCPCQPFSVCGNQDGFDDPRHLWPQFKRLIEKRRPAIVFGEQVAAASQWLAGVRSDLVAMDYAVGAIPLEAASAGADHYRDRYWFAANDDVERAGAERQKRSGEFGGPSGDPQNHSIAMEHAARFGWGEGWTEHEIRSRGLSAAVANIDGNQFIECTDGKWRRLPPSRVRWLGIGLSARVAKLRAIGNAIDPRPAAEIIRAFLETEGVL